MCLGVCIADNVCTDSKNAMCDFILNAGSPAETRGYDNCLHFNKCLIFFPFFVVLESAVLPARSAFSNRSSFNRIQCAARHAARGAIRQMRQPMKSQNVLDFQRFFVNLARSPARCRSACPSRSLLSIIPLSAVDRVLIIFAAKRRAL